MKISAILLVLIALAVIIVPQFTDCESQGRSLTLQDGRTIPMKCHWTARAEIVSGASLLTLGLIAFFTRTVEGKRIVSIMVIVTAIGIILLPLVLIGVCGAEEMVCNSTMQPVLILTGSLSALIGLVGLIASLRKVETIAS